MFIPVPPRTPGRHIPATFPFRHASTSDSGIPRDPAAIPRPRSWRTVSSHLACRAGTSSASMTKHPRPVHDIQPRPQLRPHFPRFFLNLENHAGESTGIAGTLTRHSQPSPLVDGRPSSDPIRSTSNIIKTCTSRQTPSRAISPLAQCRALPLQPSLSIGITTRKIRPRAIRLVLSSKRRTFASVTFTVPLPMSRVMTGTPVRHGPLHPNRPSQGYPAYRVLLPSQQYNPSGVRNSPTRLGCLWLPAHAGHNFPFPDHKRHPCAPVRAR